MEYYDFFLSAARFIVSQSATFYFFGCMNGKWVLMGLNWYFLLSITIITIELFARWFVSFRILMLYFYIYFFKWINCYVVLCYKEVLFLSCVCFSFVFFVRGDVTQFGVFVLLKKEKEKSQARRASLGYIFVLIVRLLFWCRRRCPCCWRLVFVSPLPTGALAAGLSSAPS